MAKYLDYDKMQKALFKRTEGYSASVKSIYQKALNEIIDLVKDTELDDGVPFSFAAYGYSDKVTPILRRMYSQTYHVIHDGSEKEWINACEHNDQLVQAIFGKKSIGDHHFARFFQRNEEAMDAFLSRKTAGMNLSQKVWNLTGLYKTELENSLDLAIGEGTPAMTLASKIKKYLNDPDSFYRRFRVKIGEDENGNPIYGRIWKRRIWSNEEQSYKWIDADPKQKHPGKGVYRSSARNAQRLARTETNIAYRSSEFERWQQMPFVIGLEIKLSNNHPVPDICDDLIGVYPPYTKFVGFHSNCRCYQVPKIAEKDILDKMLDKILDDEDPASVIDPGTINEPPDGLRTWIRNNEERYEKAKAKGTLSYFFKDNQDLVNKALHGLSPEEQKALSFGDVLKDPVSLLKKFSVSDLESVYNAVKGKLNQIYGGGTLESQKGSLEFEIKWVTDHKKYATWEVAADAYSKALDEINKRIAQQALKKEFASIESYAISHKSAKLKTVAKQIQNAIDSDDSASVEALIKQANEIIDKLKAKQLKASTKSVTDLEKYCDKHRTFESTVKDQKSFTVFQNRMINDSTDPRLNGTDAGRSVVSSYTNGAYDRINASYWRDKTGCQDGTDMGTILDHCALSEDTVLRRGANMSELQSIFGDDFYRFADTGDIAALNKMAGCRGVNEAFISTSYDMEGGFWKSVDFRIYAPKGTQALYAKPISGFGDGNGARWDGKSANSKFTQGRENEVIVNRGYEYRFIRAESGGSHGSRITIYIELLSRDKRMVK